MSRYIDADKVYSELIEEYPSDSDRILKVDYDDIRRIVLYFIDDAVPTEDVKPIIRGKWICASGSCAVCNKCNRLNEMYGNFCKHCGADMREESEEEE